MCFSVITVKLKGCLAKVIFTEHCSIDSRYSFVLGGDSLGTFDIASYGFEFLVCCIELL